MRPLSFGAKMAIIGAVFLAPIVLLIVLLYTQIDADVKFYQLERLGVAYTRALRPLFADLEALRLADGRPPAASALRARIDADLALAFTEDAGRGRPLQLTHDLRALAAQEHARAAPGSMVDTFITLLGSISDNSKITLDPILDGYYVGDTMVNKIPSLIDSVARASLVGANWLRSGHISSDARIDMTILAGQVNIARVGIEHNVPIATSAAPYLHAGLDSWRTRERATSSAFASWLESNLLAPAKPRGTLGELAVGRTRAIASGLGLYDASIDAMDEVLRRRIAALLQREISTFAVVIVALMVASVLMSLTTRSMAQMLTDKTALEREVIERTHVEAQLAHAAFHDDLTRSHEPRVPHGSTRPHRRARQRVAAALGDPLSRSRPLQGHQRQSGPYQRRPRPR